jgi:predicted transcriptional regulator
MVEWGETVSRSTDDFPMTPISIPISPATQTALLELAARTGRPAAELLDAAVEEFRQRLATTQPIASIPGVNPAEVWEADAQADAGRLTPHDDVFARLRNRQ